jgi:hypothetical protein
MGSRESGVELAEVGGSAGDDCVMALASVEDDAGVDGVVGAALAAQDPGGLGFGLIEGGHGDIGEVEGAGEPRLARAGPPGLGEGAGGDVDGKTCGVGFIEQCLHSAVGSFDGDEGSGVQSDAGHYSSPSASARYPAICEVGRPTRT